MEKAVLENHKRYIERKKIYQSYGLDIEKERKFILDKSEPLFGSILEVGTGKGHFTTALANEGYRFVSVDISKEEQDIARLNLRYFNLEDYVDFRIENAEHLSFKNGSFDVVFAINVVHHLKNHFKAMDELIRIVSFEGKIILSDFNKSGFEILDNIHASEGRIHEKENIALHDIENYFKSKGFKADQYESEFQKMLTVYKQVI